MVNTLGLVELLEKVISSHGQILWQTLDYVTLVNTGVETEIKFTLEDQYAAACIIEQQNISRETC